MWLIKFARESLQVCGGGERGAEEAAEGAGGGGGEQSQGENGSSHQGQ